MQISEKITEKKNVNWMKQVVMRRRALRSHVILLNRGYYEQENQNRFEINYESYLIITVA